MSARRNIPRVDRVLRELGEMGMPRPVVVSLVRSELSALRASGEIPGHDEIMSRIQAVVARFRQSRIRPVINGTGVLIHTNLGRAPLGEGAIRETKEIAGSYTNLELDLGTGKRGGRSGYLEHNLALLCRAEAATVVNNCAAALVLMLRHFCAGEKPEVVISRGELIQIGGGFRIPDILETSGARICEVGATNRTTVEDYAGVIGSRTGLILKVHRSNFSMEGFVGSPSTEEIADLARKRRVPFAEDLGSGAVLPTESLAPIAHEPTPPEILRRGVQLVCFSGDKLFGGPQAGILAGKRRLIRALKKEPFYRALRCDKLILAALQSTVDAYLRGKPEEFVPVCALLAASTDSLQARARRIVAALGDLPVAAACVASKAAVGGGSLPKAEIPSFAIAIKPETMTADGLANRLRAGAPPVIGLVERGRLKLDLRTIFPAQDGVVITALSRAIASC